MGIVVYSLSWVTQDLYHQPYERPVERVVCIWIRSMVVMITEAGSVLAPISGERRLVQLLEGLGILGFLGFKGV